MILEGSFGALPIEIKIGSTIKSRHLQPLKNFIAQNDLSLGILINNSNEVQLIADGILQLPATLV